MKRILILLLSVSLMVSAMVFSFGEQKKGLLVLGDSIASGYGLPGYLAGEDNYDIMSFANLTAQHLGLKRGEYKNLSIDGQTTEGLLYTLSSGVDGGLSYDYIILSIGGNDLIDSLTPLILSAISELSGNSYKQMQLIEKLTAYKEKIMDNVMGVIDRGEKNANDIFKILRQNNNNGYIGVLTVYNPFEVLRDKGYLSYINSIIIAPIINRLNERIIKTADKYGVRVIDAAQVINSQPSLYTNIEKMDIHPSVQGHLEISELIKGSVAKFKER